MKQWTSRLKTIFIFCLFLISPWLTCGGPGESAEIDREQPPKNIILMIGDGMGPATVTATRLYKYGPGEGRLSFEKFPVIGYQFTHSADHAVTDSAAAASAWACGEKFLNGEISCHDTDGDGRCDSVPQTILELAKAKGKSTGLVVTATLTHATPAAFAAHVADRDCEREIARQYIEISRVDLLLGGGFGSDALKCRIRASIGENALLKAAQAQYGYLLIKNRTGMKDIAGADRILGIFTEKAKTPETHRLDSSVVYPREEPTLEEMATMALEFLSRDPDGFLLVLEGSQIDWAHHRHDIRYMLSEMLAFDAAVSTAVEWLGKRPEIGKKTLILVMADHETGGFAIVGPDDKPVVKGVPAEVKWSAGYHTAVDTLIWSAGPGSRQFGKALDNTEIHSILRSYMEHGN